MRFLFSLSIVFLCIFGNIESNKRQKRKAAKPIFGGLLDIGRSITSAALGIASSIKDDEKHDEIIAKFDSINITLIQMQENFHVTHVLITSILHEIHKSAYGFTVAEAEREIIHCFDSFKVFAMSPRSEQSINNMKACYSIMPHVKQIARILGGHKIGISSEGLFDIFIREHGHCNGTVITGLKIILNRLLMQGCASVVLAEALIYPNISSQYQYDCTLAFNETDAYAENLFQKCSVEDCDVILNSMNVILQDVTSLTDASAALYSHFPWFYFTIIESKKCYLESLKIYETFPFNLHTFDGKLNTYIVLFGDKPYLKTEIGKASGFRVPRSCWVDYINDLDITILNVDIYEDISLYMYQKKSAESSKICKGIPTKSEDENEETDSSSRATPYNVHVATLIAIIFMINVMIKTMS